MDYRVEYEVALSLVGRELADTDALVEERAGMPVRLWDERRTTIEAHQILHAVQPAGGG